MTHHHREHRYPRLMATSILCILMLGMAGVLAAAMGHWVETGWLALACMPALGLTLWAERPKKAPRE